MDTLGRMADNSIDSVVTDPPYELGFMGKSWDRSGITYSVEFWKEVFRVLKPGGHLLSFGGSRTYHRMTCAIEDAGFEIRDMIEWVYGSGFPKSLNIGKALDKSAGVEREVIGEKFNKNRKNGSIACVGLNTDSSFDLITAPATDSAKQWDGWGTALKPAHEPICMARKPIDGTVAANVLKYGTGGINVDVCRVEGIEPHHNYGRTSGEKSFVGVSEVPSVTPPSGRFPANLIHDGSPEVVAMFPVTNNVGHAPRNGKGSPFGGDNDTPRSEFYMSDKGSAARFFYCAKPSPAERNMGCDNIERGCFHPTVKPISLMCYLVRLVTPPGGVCYDPFVGSGTTPMACKKEGFNYIGSEMTDEYIPIIHARLSAVVKDEPVQSNQLAMF